VLCGSNEAAWLQASYHGFGLTVQAETLVSTKGEALHAAVTQILAKPSYTVRTQNAAVHCW